MDNSALYISNWRTLRITAGGRSSRLIIIETPLPSPSGRCATPPPKPPWWRGAVNFGPTAKTASSPPISPTPNQSTNTGQVQGTPAESNGLATAALVLGILSALFFEFVFVPIAALVVSSFALSKSTSLANKGQKKTGKGKSIAGLILGGVYLFTWFGWNVLGWGPGR